MKLITRETDYAVRALCLMAKNEKNIISVAELIKKLRLPRPFLRKILQVLSQKGIVKSYRGQKGGFELGRTPNKIYLLDLVKIFQGPLEFNNCIFKKRVCPETKCCQLRPRIKIIEKHLASELKSITIQSLIKTY